MATVSINDFAKGWDLRRGTVMAPPNSLRKLDNAFVNAGGEIEKRKAFIQTADSAQMAAYPTIGLAGSSVLETFGNPTTPATWSSVFPYLAYREVSGITTASKIHDADLFQGTHYLIADFGGTIRHIYGGTIVATAPAGARQAKTHRGKIYTVTGNSVYFSSLNDPSTYTGIGSGMIYVDTQDVGMLDLVTVETYYDKLALIGRRGVMLWSMNADPALNTMVQTMSNIGCIAEQAVARVGDGDVLMLHPSGIRSLRARASDTVAATTDTGSPIDEVIKAKIRSGVHDRIMARVDPATGQFWLMWDTDIYVLSLVPSGGITAWSRYTIPASADYATAAGGQLWYRNIHGIYLFGGWDNNTYDETVAEVITPFYNANSPTTEKQWQSFDIAAEGTWTVEACSDPLHPDAWATIATISGPSYSQHKIGMQFTSTHIALRLRSVGTGPARIGAIHMQFAGGETD